jgi:glycosyltransferase involved in cell wall biosynthesis
MTALSIKAPAPRATAAADAPLRVLHLSAGNMYGGIERVLTVLAEERGLAPAMEPSFGLCFPGRLHDELAAAGVAVFDFGPVRLSRPWTVSKARRNLRRVLGDRAFDLVVTHGFWSHAAFGPAVRRTEAALVHWAHGPFDDGRWLDRLGTWTPPDLLLANSRFTADSFKAAFPGVRREVVGLPARLSPPRNTTEIRENLRRSLGTPEGAVVVVMVSRIEPLKGHAPLLDALASIDGGKSWECWIVGGAQRSEEVRLLKSLQRQAAAAGLDRVRFLGARSDVADLLAAADVYCQPNTGPDSFGLSFVEALDAGLPIVTSRLGGPPEFLDDSCAILTAPGDADAVAAALGRLIGDAELRRELGRHGPAKARAACDPTERLAALQQALASVRKAVRWA